jgi:hypothetical protein
VFPKIKGVVVETELKLPKAIEFIDVLHTWPIRLETTFNPDEHLREGAYLGCGQDEFADSWIAFNCAQNNDKVVLAIESKQRSRREPLTAKYFDDHKKKVCVACSFIGYTYTIYGSHCLPADAGGEFR